MKLTKEELFIVDRALSEGIDMYKEIIKINSCLKTKEMNDELKELKIIQQEYIDLKKKIEDYLNIEIEIE